VDAAEQNDQQRLDNDRRWRELSVSADFDQ
jgi:hypothetical protein